MAAEIDNLPGSWRLSLRPTERRDRRRSVLPLVSARQIREGWIKQEDLAGLSDEKLEQIREFAEFGT